METKLTSVFSQFGCRQIPNPTNLNLLLQKAAKFEFSIKPAAALHPINVGIPENHHPFWDKRGVGGVVSLYRSLAATPSAVLSILKCYPEPTGDRERIFSYLKTLIGNLKPKELQHFLRFATGSSSLVTGSVTVEFNCLTGIARRPIAHTCSSSIELSSQYTNFEDFEGDFVPILQGLSPHVWEMNSV